MNKKVLGLDIGSNSIGYSLLELNEQNDEIVFNELISNSIVFSEPNTAEERRDGRSSRRRNERKSARKKATRKLFVKYNIASKGFIEKTTQYLNKLSIDDTDVYRIREKAVNGDMLTKDEFLFCTYSILTDRGYNNMFSTSKEDGVINDAVLKNREKFKVGEYLLPSMVLTEERKEQEDRYQNLPIRNKKDDYRNSLDRDMHKEEFSKVALSQSDNKSLFKSTKECQKFIDEVLDETVVNAPFFQRPLKSFEGMVEFCTFYDKFNPNGSEKRMPLAHIKNIELTLRQKIDNYEISNIETGEIKSSREMLSIDEIETIIDFWIYTPSSNEINAKNIFKATGLKDIKLEIPEKSSQIILNIQAHRNVLEVLKEYEIDFSNTHQEFYTKLLLILYYFKNQSLREEEVSKLLEAYKIEVEDSFSQKVSILENMDGFSSFSLKFTDEVLTKMSEENKTHHEALESLGYYSKYLKMPTYNYLPPLEPTHKDIKWLQNNLDYFETKHLFYQPMMSPKVKRVIAVLRKLMNELIKTYGVIDEIRIETSKEMNSKVEKEKIDENQKKDRNKNNEADKLLESHEIVKSSTNMERAKLWKEQGGKCLYSGENIVLTEAFDENETEVEHFIPRSVIWINSYKNKILVKKKYNQDKSDRHPIEYLKSIGEWEDFKGRVQDTFMVFKKKDWLTKEEIINSVMQKEHWKDSYLNDTRSATRVIQKYLNHYLYPKENMYGRDEKRSIVSVSGRAINELKYMWGIHKIMPKNSDDKKDRNTNYHHTLDAFTVALCSTGAVNTLHSYFKKKENAFKTKAMKENLTNSLPQTKEGVNVVEHLQKLVEKYETNQLYVFPYNKRKTNMKGFKDGNKKLYITNNPKDETKEILAEMEKVAIDTTILVKKVGLNVKDRKDDEVKKFIKEVQDRLDKEKQAKIIVAIEVYANRLMELRSEVVALDKEINSLNKTKKRGKQHKENNALIEESIKPIREIKKSLLQEEKELKCSYLVKGNKEQIVKSLKLYKTKIEKSKADAIIFHQRKNNKIERLSLSNYMNALNDKEPFVIKENESTLYVELFNTKSRGQAVGLNYFSSIVNNIATKINSKFDDEINSNVVADLVLYKNDIVKVIDTKKETVNYHIFNGGGNIAGGNNKLELKTINKSTKQRLYITLNKTTHVSKVKIDFFGNIIED